MTEFTIQLYCPQKHSRNKKKNLCVGKEKCKLRGGFIIKDGVKWMKPCAIETMEIWMIDAEDRMACI